MALITVNSSQQAKPSNPSPVMPAAESGSDNFQKVLEQQLSQHAAQNNRDSAPKSNDRNTPNATDMPEKSVLANDTLRASHKKFLEHAESQSDAHKGLGEVEANALLLNQLPSQSVNAPIGADELQLQMLMNPDETMHEPVVLPQTDLNPPVNALLPMLNMLNFTPMPQARGEPAETAPDSNVLNTFTSASVTGQDQPLSASHLKDKTEALDLPSMTEQRNTDFSQKIVEVLKAPADAQKDLTVKSLQKQEAVATPVNLGIATAAFAATTNSSPVSNSAITPQLGTPAWNEAIGQKIVWMVGAEQQSATLTLNPPDLGPVQVVIQVQNDHADTTFISQNPDVRQALEDGMDNLRNMMNSTGIQLGQANVHSEQQSQSQPQHSIQTVNKTTDAVQAPVTTRSRRVMASNGLVDTFA